MEEDIILIEKARQGDEDSLNLLMNNYKNFVNKIAKKYFIIGADNNDVIQEGMIGLFNAYNKFDKSKNVLFKTFASVCINRQIITAIKKAYKNSKSEFFDDISGEILKSNTVYLSPEEDVILKEDYDNLLKEISEKLSTMENKIFNEFLKEQNYDEISKKLNISKKSVDNALSRIRSKLKYLKWYFYILIK